ncbi:MAG: DinB family protein [Acidimicrobiales bacterium]
MGRPCPGCGVDEEAIGALDAINTVRSFPRRYRAALATLNYDPAFNTLVRTRPRPDEWSALEYTGHAADVVDRLAPAIRRIQAEDRPRLELFDLEAHVAEARYNERPWTDAVWALETACSDMASTLETVEPEEWARTGTFDWGERDILAAARHAVHEGAHHLGDVERVLAALGAA